MPPPPGARVDVVIPTFDARDLVLECLEHLDDPAIARVVVVDDVSADDTRRAVPDRFPGVRLVELDEHRGLAHALNRGAQAGSAEFVLFLNNDVFARPAAVSRLVAALAGDADAASAGGRLVDPGTTRTQDSYRPRAIPGLAGIVVRLLGIERLWPANPWTGQHLRDPLDDATTRRTSQQPAGACLLVRRAALEETGGWDERYWIWYEDVDFSRRLLESGPALYVPSAVFEHVGGASTGGWPRAELHRRLYHGTIQYGAAHFSRGRRLVLGVVLIAVSLPRIAVHRLRAGDAGRVYLEVARGALALCLDREVPSLMRSLRRRS